MGTIYEKLSAYSQSDYYGFHMPGHKRHLVEEMPDLPYHLDITEDVYKRQQFSIGGGNNQS